MRVLPGVSVTRLVHNIPGGRRAWTFPYFAVRAGRRWWFPLGWGWPTEAELDRRNAETAARYKEPAVGPVGPSGVSPPPALVLRSDGFALRCETCDHLIIGASDGDFPADVIVRSVHRHRCKLTDACQGCTVSLAVCRVEGGRCCDLCQHHPAETDPKDSP